MTKAASGRYMVLERAKSSPMLCEWQAGIHLNWDWRQQADVGIDGFVDELAQFYLDTNERLSSGMVSGQPSDQMLDPGLITFQENLSRGIREGNTVVLINNGDGVTTTTDEYLDEKTANEVFNRTVRDLREDDWRLNMHTVDGCTMFHAPKVVAPKIVPSTKAQSESDGVNHAKSAAKKLSIGTESNSAMKLSPQPSSHRPPTSSH